MRDTHLGEGDAEVDGPAVAQHGDDHESHHHSHVVRSGQGKERPEDDHDGDGDGLLPLPVSDDTSEEGQAQGTHRDGQPLRGRQGGCLLPRLTSVGVADADHRGPDDAAGIVKHVDDRECDTRCSEVAALASDKDLGWRKWVLGEAVSFPQCEENQDDKAHDQVDNHVAITRRVDGGIDDAEEDRERTTNKQDHANVVELFQGDTQRQSKRMSRWVVEEIEAEERKTLQGCSDIKVDSPVTAVDTENKN